MAVVLYTLIIVVLLLPADFTPLSNSRSPGRYEGRIPQEPSISALQSTTIAHKDYDLGLCDICLEGIEVVNKLINGNKTFQDIKPYALDVCVEALTFRGYHGDIVCPGIVESYGPGTWFIFDQIALNPIRICTDLNYCEPDIQSLFDDTIAGHGTPVPRQDVKQPTDQFKAPLKDTKSSTNPLRILQLSDIHVDPYYTVGSVTDCKLFLCCRAHFNGTGSAGRYGHYSKCDLPVHTFNIILSAIRQLDPKPDFIIYTGDSPPHDVWLESWSTQLRGDQLIVDMVNAQLDDFQIYPAIGNHESFPESFYYQPDAAYKMLNTKLADWWSTWFNVSADQRETIARSAYYTALVRPGLRVLSFNTDYGYAQNFYFLLNARIPAYQEQLLFMETVLKGARAANEKVIVIGHVPPGDHGSSTMHYGDFYTSLVLNYSDVICLQLFGHTHHDSFELIFSKDNKAYGPVYISPSVTTYGEVNPGFRVYELDPDSFQLLDYNQYYLNLTAANAANRTEVKLFYSARQEYGLTDLTAESWKELTDRMATDTKLFDLYRRNFLTGSGLEGSCDESCKRKTLCALRSASKRARLQCLRTKQSKHNISL